MRAQGEPARLPPPTIGPSRPPPVFEALMIMPPTMRLAPKWKPQMSTGSAFRATKVNANRNAVARAQQTGDQRDEPATAQTTPPHVIATAECPRSVPPDDRQRPRRARDRSGLVEQERQWAPAHRRSPLRVMFELDTTMPVVHELAPIGIGDASSSLRTSSPRPAAPNLMKRSDRWSP